MADRIFLDHQATTPLDPRVREAMLPWLGDRFGHPASPHHAFGWDAAAALGEARGRVAALLGAEPREIVFTSGGAEADSLAVRGTLEALHATGRHVVTSAIERGSVRETIRLLVARGWTSTEVPVDREARVDPAAVAEAIRDDTVLVSVQAANHEVGTVQDLAAIGERCAERKVLFHADATHAAAWIPLPVRELGIHLLSLTGHLMHGPMGIGALYVSRRKPRVAPTPLIPTAGGALRGGTPNLVGAVGLGVACALCGDHRAADVARVSALRDHLESRIRDGAYGVERLGCPASRLPNVSAIAIDGVEGEAVVLGASDVAMATGSACTSPTLEPSHVLEALGLEKRRIDTTLRFGLGRFTTEPEVDQAAQAVLDAVERIRANA